jgi:hypothetical protein
LTVKGNGKIEKEGVRGISPLTRRHQSRDVSDAYLAVDFRKIFGSMIWERLLKQVVKNMNG